MRGKILGPASSVFPLSGSGSAEGVEGYTVKRAAVGLLLVIASFSLIVDQLAVAQNLPPAAVVGSVLLFHSAEHHQVLGSGDLDGDGYLDIVLGGPQDLVLLWGQGGGNFQDAGHRVPYAFVLGPRDKHGFRPLTPVGEFLPICGAVSDLDGDGDKDVVAVVINQETRGHELVVFENRARRYLWSTQRLGLPLERGTAEEIYILVWGLWVGDLNGDGYTDIVLGARTPQAWEVWALAGTGSLCWGDPLTVQALPADTPTPVLEDLNNDGVPDIIMLRDKNTVGVMMAKNRAPRLEFSSPLWLDIQLGEVLQVGAGDVDGDGTLDLVVLTRQGLEVWFQRGALFEPGPLLNKEPWGTKLYLGKFNGDEWLDVLFPVGPFRWAILSGVGAAGFHPHGSEHLILDLELVVLDLDSDGRSELLTAHGSTLRAYFPRPRGESRVPIDATAIVAVGDLSGNGAADVLAWHREGFVVLWNDGRGGLIRQEFHRGQYLPLAVQIHEGRVYILNHVTQYDWMTKSTVTKGELVVLDRAGQVTSRLELVTAPRAALCVRDFDGDGDPDVLVLGPHEVVVAWSGRELERYPWTAGELSLAWALAGENEVFVVSTAEYAEIYALAVDRQGPRTLGDPLQLLGIPVALAAADLDGDGRLDPVALCWQPVVEAGSLKSAVTLGVGYSSQGLREWELMRDEAPHPLTGLAVADFNGDGAPDIAFTLASGLGAHVLWNKGRGELTSPVWLRVSVGPLAAADLDRNGAAEILASTVGLAPHLWILWNRGAPWGG